MTGWLGGAYLWVQAAHVIFVMFFVAGLFIGSRHLAYHSATVPGSREDAQWIARERQLLRIILTPAVTAVWLLGLALAFHIGFEGNGWLHAKIALVLLMTGFHGFIAATIKKMARGERPRREATWRKLGEIPAVLTVGIVILAIVKPF